MNIIDLLIRLISSLLSFWFFGVSTPVRPSEPPPPPVSSGAQPMQSFVTVYSVDVLVLESFPMQVHLQVAGEHPVGCEFPTQVLQQREGNTVTLSIYQEIPPDVMCPMILRPYSDTIPLDGTFEPGDYVFIVNEFVVERTL